jgi:MSHA biogenesis protein MshK
MDETVKRVLAGPLLLLLLAAQGAGAQALQDPTRPPAALTGRQAGDAAAGAQAERGPRLQSVLIARQPGGRHIAVIDGETLRLDDTFRGARVTRIEPNEVELRRGSTRQVLTLHAAAAPAAGAIERVQRPMKDRE